MGTKAVLLSECLSFATNTDTGHRNRFLSRLAGDRLTDQEKVITSEYPRAFQKFGTDHFGQRVSLKDN
jgi:hypothetical protein